MVDVGQGISISAKAFKWNGRNIIMVRMPDGVMQPFYRRTGGGGGVAGDGGAAGQYVPIDGIIDHPIHKGKKWMDKWSYSTREGRDIPVDDPLYRYGTDRLKAVGRHLDTVDIPEGQIFESGDYETINRILTGAEGTTDELVGGYTATAKTRYAGFINKTVQDNKINYNLPVHARQLRHQKVNEWWLEGKSVGEIKGILQHAENSDNLIYGYIHDWDRHMGDAADQAAFNVSARVEQTRSMEQMRALYTIMVRLPDDIKAKAIEGSSLWKETVGKSGDELQGTFKGK